MTTKIYVDAGHGGTDPGAIGCGGVRESTITLAVARYLQTELKRQGISVKMSRENNSTKKLATRCSEANNWGANIVISLHCNAYNTQTACGTETYVYKKGSNAEKIANLVQKNLVATLGITNRGVKEGNLAMVRDTIAPAVLCELAFITNVNDCARVNNATAQKKCAIAICKGICSYLGITYKKEVTNMAKTKFKDESKMSKWAIDSIAEVSNLGIINGDTNGNYRPKDYPTREELAVVMSNLIKYLEK